MTMFQDYYDDVRNHSGGIMLRRIILQDKGRFEGRRNFFDNDGGSAKT